MIPLVFYTQELSVSEYLHSMSTYSTTGEDDKVYWAFAWLILTGHDSLSIRRLSSALRAHSDTAFIPRHSLYIHASLIIKGTVGLEPTFLPDYFLPCSPFELRSLWRIICPPLANLVSGGKDASFARFQPPFRRACVPP